MVTSNKKVIFYTISDEYVNQLKKVDSKVQNNYDGHRLYYKTSLKVAGTSISYYVPLSSAKESQKKINNKSMFKIYGNSSSNKEKDFLGVLHINNMIPVPDKFAEPWTSYKNNNDKRYTMLVIKQAKYLANNKLNINSACKLLYDSKTGVVEPEYFKKNRRDVMLYKKITNNIKELEATSINIEEERQI